MIYYALSNDSKLDYTIEELVNKRTGLFSIDEIKEKGFFTHSCNGNMIEMIRKNGLGSDLNINEELYSAVSRLEQKLNTTGTYTKQQSGKKDEVYFTSAGATSFGYACNFAPERLFLGILRRLQKGEKIDYFTFDRIEEKEEAKKNKIFSYISKIINRVKGLEKINDVKRLPEASQNNREEPCVKGIFKNALLKRLRVSTEELAKNTERQQTKNVQTQPDKEDALRLDD